MRPAPLALALFLFAAACAPAAPTDGTPQSNAPPAQDEPAATASPAATGSPTPTVLDQALVVRVVDGDTIDVLIGGEELRLRYIGIDTPETVDPRRPVGCFGKEASARNRELVEGKTVGLEEDVSETDRFGRLLRYVWAEGEMVNATLVEEGYASASTYPPDVKYAAMFASLQSQAREAGRGLWSACGTPASPTPTGNCDPSYPDVCIPIGSADYDCAGGSGNGPNYISGPLRVLPPDPYGLDRDGDGIGCEPRPS